MHPDSLCVDHDPAFGDLHLDHELINRIIDASPERPSDIDALDGVVRMLRREIENYGERGWSLLSDEELDLLNKAYWTVSARLGVQAQRLPFRDWTEYQRWRKREHWDLRNHPISDYTELQYWDDFFNELEQHVADMLESSWTHDLFNAISPHRKTGWDTVDEEIRQLRKTFAAARSAADHSAVGHQCTRIIEALAIAAYDQSAHASFAQGSVNPSNTKNRFDAIIRAHASGGDSEAIRKLSKDIVALAQDIKHRNTPDRADAGLAADSAIFLANVIRRLTERPIIR